MSLWSSWHWICRSLWNVPEKKRQRRFSGSSARGPAGGLGPQGKELYNNRLAIGQIADRKKKFADEQPYYPDAPKELVSPTEMIKQQQDIIARNGENQRKRENLHRLEQEYQKINEQMEELLKKQKQVQDDLTVARTSAKDLQDESTAELEESIANIEEINGRCGPTWTKIKQKRRQGL